MSLELMIAGVSQLYELFLRNTLEDKILKSNQRLLVGVSGGPDSLFLLLCLLKYQAQFGWTLAIAHLNHGLRAEIADEECAFVEAIAQKWKVPFFAQKADLVSLNRDTKKGMEAAGRVSRHAFFSKIAQSWQADAVVLGHHADDQVENFLLRLLRGSGPEGLLPMRQTWFVSENLKILRPLLRIKHQDIVDFLDLTGVVYCQDLTNEEDVYLRSKIRTQLLPKLEMDSPKIRNQILNLQEMLQWDQDYLSNELIKYQAEVKRDPFGLISISCQVLARWPEALSSRWLIKQFYSLTHDGEAIQFRHISLILTKLEEQPSYWSASLPADVTVMITGGRLFLLDGAQMAFQSKTRSNFTLPNIDQLPSRWTSSDPFFCLFIEEYKGVEQSLGGLFGSKAFGKEMFLRTWQAGDTIKIISGHSKKVSDYFQERRVPIPWRSRIPIICEEEQIVLIPNHYTISTYQPELTEDRFELFIEHYPLGEERKLL